MPERRGGTALERAADRAFALLLLCYPPDFRARFGERMTDDFRARGRYALESSGRVGQLGYFAWALVGLLPSAGRTWLATLRGWAADTRGTLSALRRAPLHAGLSVVILAAGVGGSCLIFSVLYGTLLRPLPYADPDRTLVVWTWNQRQGLQDGSSYLNMADWEARSAAVAEWGFFYRPNFTDRTLTRDGADPLRISVGSVDAGFFDVLGVEPLLGRTFSEAEETAKQPVAVISHGLWVDHFGSDPDVVGKSLQFDGSLRTVVGVMPSELRLPTAATSAWEPHSLRTSWPHYLGQRGDDAFVALARVRSDVDVEAAQAELDAIAAELQREFPEENENLGVLTRPLLSELTGDDLPRTLWLFQVAAGLVLAAVAANLGHLWLVRALGRRRELAVRLALGAGGGRLVRLLLAEGLLLSVLGAALGLAGAGVLMGPTVGVLADYLPRSAEVGLHPMVAGVSFAAALLVGSVASFVSAVVATRIPVSAVLSEGARSVGSSRVRSLRAGFVVAQMGLATLLVLGAGLMLKSLDNLRSVDPGLDTSGVVVARIELPVERYEDAVALDAFVDDVLSRLRDSPGVEEAGAVSDFLFQRFPDGSITPEDSESADVPRVPMMVDWVTPGFFESVRLQVVRGRALTDADHVPSGEPRSVVINEAFARVFWPTQDPVGRRFQWGAYREDKNWHTGVGVAADTRRGGLDNAPIPQAYTVSSLRELDLTVRMSRGDPLAGIPLIRGAVAAVDPGVALTWVTPAESLLSGGLDPWRLRSAIALLAAALVVLLALLGMYGLLNEGVWSRRFEIGVRLALGAAPGTVGLRVLAQGLGYASVGLALGVVFTAAVSRALGSFLYEVSPLDPTTILVAGTGLFALAALVSWVPARRATRVDPARCLSTD